MSLEELEEIRLDCQREVYGGRLNLGEIGAKDFMRWYQWRMEQSPLESCGEPLENFDIESVIGIFEQWVKNEKDK